MIDSLSARFPLLAWYEERNCTHAECPNGCDKPQPLFGDDGKLYCGRCLAFDGVLVECVPCTPDLCDDA